MNYINDIELGNYIDKMDFYLNEEKKYKLAIKNNFDSTELNYKSSNTKKLNELNIELDEKIKKINDMHQTDLLILTNVVSNYTETSLETLNILNNIEEVI